MVYSQDYSCNIGCTTRKEQGCILKDLEQRLDGGFRVGRHHLPSGHHRGVLQSPILHDLAHMNGASYHIHLSYIKWQHLVALCSDVLTIRCKCNKTPTMTGGQRTAMRCSEGASLGSPSLLLS